MTFYMQPDQWKEVKERFRKALELPPEERAEYLKRVCAGNDSVRLVVESLIKAHDDSDRSLDLPAAAYVLVDSPTLKPGDMIAHYEIRCLLGEGGMGKVYRAADTKLKRDVALKVLVTELGENNSRKRFLREARAAAALDHPNICGIYEVGEYGEHSYIAMQYVEGETLASRMRVGEISPSEALTISIQVADALATAHQRNVIHRDIKPSNLMLTARGDVKVVDFGLAKITAREIESLSEAETTLLTHPGLILGTVPYMSPEQARGQEVDARSDIWSLGVVLYELIARRPPFAGQSNADTLAAILSKEPPPLGDYSSQLSPEIERIVGKMLGKNPEERYQTARDLLVDLKALYKLCTLENETATTKPPKPVETPRLSFAPFARPKWWLGAITLLLITAAVLAVWRSSRGPQITNKPRLEGIVQVTTWPGLDIHPSLSPNGNSIAYSSDHGGRFEIYVRPMIPGSRETQLTNDGQANFQPAWSPDGQWIAYHSKNRGGIWVVPATGGNAKQVSQFGSDPAWSKDGRWLAFQSHPGTDLGAHASAAQPPSLIWLVPANGSAEPTKLTQLGHPSGGHGSPSWSPDGKHIAMSVSDFGSNAIWIIPRYGGEPQLALEYGLDPVYGPDGKRLYYATASGLWEIQISPETGRPIGEAVQLTNSAVERIRYFSVSDDGKKLVYAGLLSNSNLWSLPVDKVSGLPSGTPNPLTQDRSFRNGIPAFSHDGKRIAFNTQKTGRAGAEGDLWLMHADGKNARQVTTEGGGLVSWFPGGEQLAFMSSRDSRKMWIANLQTGQEKTLSWDFGEEVNYMRLSFDGKQVVFNSNRTGTTNTWKISFDGSELKQLTFDKEFMGYACWSRDGELLGLQIKRGEDTHIGFMSSDGGLVTQLTFDKGQSWLNSFSPDGDKIAFAGFRDGVWNLYWVSRITKEQKKLTEYSKVNSFVRYPGWSPSGDQIAYEYVEITGNVWVAEIR